MDARHNSRSDRRIRCGDTGVESDAWPMKALFRVDAAMQRYSWIATWTLWAALAIVIVQAMDRDAPFKVVHVHPASARPGEAVVIYADVWRDPSRACSVSMGRSLFDGARDRYDFPVMTFTSEAIEKMQARTPDKMATALIVPQSAKPGEAEIVGALEYRCNQAHALWPIQVTTHLPFTILP
jgi:hypothetical protein